MIEASFRRADRPCAIGAWSGLAGVATALGPLLSGTGELALFTQVRWPSLPTARRALSGP
jgi:hypothetical protein